MGFSLLQDSKSKDDLNYTAILYVLDQFQIIEDKKLYCSYLLGGGLLLIFYFLFHTTKPNSYIIITYMSPITYILPIISP